MQDASMTGLMNGTKNEMTQEAKIDVSFQKMLYLATMEIVTMRIVGHSDDRTTANI